MSIDLNRDARPEVPARRGVLTMIAALFVLLRPLGPPGWQAPPSSTTALPARFLRMCRAWAIRRPRHLNSGI